MTAGDAALLYGRLEERVLARDQVGASRVFYDLVRRARVERRPARSVQAFHGGPRRVTHGRRALQADGSGVRRRSLSDLSPPARRGPRPSESPRLLGAHPLPGRGGSAAGPTRRQGSDRRVRGGAFRHGGAVGARAFDAWPWPAGPPTPPPPRAQGGH